MTDTASHYDYMKFANLGLQISSDLPHSAILRRKLHSFFVTSLLQIQDKIIRKSSNITDPSAEDITIFSTQSPSKRYRTDLLNFSSSSNSLPQNLISRHSNPFAFKSTDRLLHLTINISISSLEKKNEYMKKKLKRFNISLHQMFFFE